MEIDQLEPFGQRALIGIEAQERPVGDLAVDAQLDFSLLYAVEVEHLRCFCEGGHYQPVNVRGG